jgi:murein DD-endopeptidase MepM/ murein hydrolase activator NlpD
MRKLILAVAVLVFLAVGVYVAAGRAVGPAIRITKPEKFVGVSTPVQVEVDAPGGRVSSLSVVFEQNGVSTPLSSHGLLPQEGADTRHVTGQVSRESVPGLRSGAARIVVTASRPVLFGLRQVQSHATRDVQVRLESPRVSVLSTHHYVNLGGAEMVVYRVAPDDVESGVIVGDLEYLGFPASGATVEGVKIADPAVRVAFFALMYDQDVNAPIQAFARDEAGNSARADFEHRSFPKPFKKSRIELNDRFLDRVVPAILAGSPELKPQGSTIDKFVVINGDLRHRNAETIASFARKTAPEMFWRGVVFHPFGNTKVESAFADQRTYLYGGREVDHQVHLGFDLASFANASIVAANRGRVLFAGDLGIYGNAVIIDHGMGVQSLYAHLSSIAVQPGAMVEKDQPIGRSGMTGLAAGDHLHFTMLVNGHMVNPVEWWDPHWVEDRILRKLRAAQ